MRRWWTGRPSPSSGARPGYLTGVPAGDHVVSLVAPVNCSVETDPQSVTVTVGALIRDTVEVTFAVVCQIEYGALKVSASQLRGNRRVSATRSRCAIAGPIQLCASTWVEWPPMTFW